MIGSEDDDNALEVGHLMSRELEGMLKEETIVTGERITNKLIMGFNRSVDMMFMHSGTALAFASDTKSSKFKRESQFSCTERRTLG